MGTTTCWVPIFFSKITPPYSATIDRGTIYGVKDTYFCSMSRQPLLKQFNVAWRANWCRVGICSSAHCSFAHLQKISQDKWANVSNLLRSLWTNERLWANRLGRSWQISKCERFAQVAQDKWANCSVFWANRSFSRLLTKNERFPQKLFTVF